MENPQAGEQTHNAGPYDDNGLPVVIWRESKRGAQRQQAAYGLADALRKLKVGDVIPLGNFKRSSVPSSARQLNIIVETKKGYDGNVYIRRIS